MAMESCVEHQHLICPHCAGKGIMLRLSNGGRTVTCMMCSKSYDFNKLRVNIEKTSAPRLPSKMYQSRFDYDQGVKQELEKSVNRNKANYRTKLVALDIGPAKKITPEKPRLTFLEFKLICFVRMYRQLKNAYGKCPKLCDKYWAVRDCSGNPERMAFYINALQRNGVNVNLIR